MDLKIVKKRKKARLTVTFTAFHLFNIETKCVEIRFLKLFFVSLYHCGIVFFKPFLKATKLTNRNVYQ